MTKAFFLQKFSRPLSSKKFDDNTQFVYNHRIFLLEKGQGGICKNNVILHVYSGANVSYLASDHLCIRAYSFQVMYMM